jgi:TPR repeat protein
MKKILPLILCILLTLDTYADEYKILRLNTESIVIGGKICRKDSTFNDTWEIKWTVDRQCMTVQNVKNHTIVYLTHEASDSKNAVSLKDYLVRNAQLSGKDGENWLTYPAKHTDKFTDRRIALVIGNANYTNYAKLKNPLNDVTAVGEQLRQLGFDVICLYDATYDMMLEVLNWFRQKAVQGQYDFALFYYSGHGLQYDGKNWILPVEANLEHSSDLKTQCLDGQDLLTMIDDTECEGKVVVLDACRTEKINWKEEDDAVKEESKSYVSMEPRRGMLLAYSTRSGDVAQDVSLENNDMGPYALAFVNKLQEENLSLDDLFNEVRYSVEAMTSSTQSPIHTNGTLCKWIINGKNVMVPKSAFNQQDNSSTFLTYILDLAENGDKEAQFQLGTCYEFGVNKVARDYPSAIQWYQKAAKQGHPEAINKIGTYHFLNGNYKEALKCYHSAAKLGNRNAQYNLGMMYTSDQYGVMDVQKGVKWYRLAAEAGLAAAQFEMGICYLYGIGVVKYSTNAIPWFEKAAAQGHDEAQYMLAQCYLRGEGVFQNYKEAFKYFQQAADQNNAPAQYGLCTCYYDGLGIEKNMTNAIYWCKKAAEQGNEKAIRRLKFLDYTE